MFGGAVITANMAAKQPTAAGVRSLNVFKTPADVSSCFCGD